MFLLNYRRHSVLLLLGLLALLNPQCDRKKSADSAVSEGSIHVEVRVPPPSGSEERAAKVTLAHGRLRISGEGMTPIDTLLTVQDGMIEARITDIPVGLRRVELGLEDDNGRRYWEASTEVTVRKGEMAKATLVLSRVGDVPPQIVTVEIIPAAGSTDSLFAFRAVVEDVHDPTDSLQIRWDFNSDGTFDVDWTYSKEVDHTYGTAGDFTVKLEVRDRTKQTNTTTRSVQVFELFAQTGINVGPDTLQATLTEARIRLDAGQSRGRLGGELIYHWSQVLDVVGAHDVSVIGTFSDNHSTTASRMFCEPLGGRGWYVFSLQVEDKESGVFSNTDTLFVLVSSMPPVVSIADPPAEVKVGEVVHLTGQASDADDDELQYRWRGERVDLLSDTTSTTTVFTPAQVGEYHFSFVAIDTDPQESEPAEVIIPVGEKPNTVPMANAGPDQSVSVGATVRLDGSRSRDEDGDILSYHWTVPAGITLSSATDAQPQFTVNEAGTYRFILEVNDGKVDSAPDEVVITVTETAIENSAPVANAGPDQSGERGKNFTLDGGGSSDPEGNALTYVWTENTDNPVKGSLSDATAEAPTFTATEAGVYRFSLIVNDGQLNSAPDEVKITVVQPNRVPVADAGVDRSGETGQTFILDGSGSSDADGDELSYQWSAPAGIVLSSEMDVRPRFSATSAGTYTFILVVNDGQVDSAPDEVVVTVTKPLGLPGEIGETITVELPGGATMEMVWIEPGTFMMGSPMSEEGRNSDEGPQHQVTISQGFYLGKYELTQGQWEAVMWTTPWVGQERVIPNPNHPAVYISWNDVQAFIHELNEAVGDSLYRLPTEAEWEYACRAGTATRWSFGNDEDRLRDYAWYMDNARAIGEDYAHSVGTKLPNPWGLYDMHGNVYEWVQDWYGSYSSSARVDPTGPASDSTRVLRGGRFLTRARHARSAGRHNLSPIYQGIGIGARLLRMAEPVPSQEGAVISFADPNLEAAVREAIDKPEGDILQSDVAELRELDASEPEQPERKIASLDGMENLTSLTVLRLGGNQISNLSALKGFTQLKELRLGGNQLSDMSIGL